MQHTIVYSPVTHRPSVVPVYDPRVAQPITRIAGFTVKLEGAGK